MGISLKKGKVINLYSEAINVGIASLTSVGVGLGWDCNTRGGADYDLDAWALVIQERTPGDRFVERENLVYFANRQDSSRWIRHMGDNLTGAGDGDDETILLDLNRLPYDYVSVLIGVTIYHAHDRRQSFGNIQNAFIRVYDDTTGIEICRYDEQFSREYADCTTLLFGALNRKSDNPDVWVFEAVGLGSNSDSISASLRSRGVIDEFKNYIPAAFVAAAACAVTKGSKISLAKVASDAGIEHLSKIKVGLGWDVNPAAGNMDLDASAFLTAENGKVRNDNDFIYYNNLKANGIEHSGDNRTGDSEGDDEVIHVNLDEVDPDVKKISFTVTINDAEEKHQSFGQVTNSYIHVLDEATNTELLRYDLGEQFSVETAIVAAEIYRNNGEWKFSAVGAGFNGGLAALCNNFGIEVE